MTHDTRSDLEKLFDEMVKEETLNEETWLKQILDRAKAQKKFGGVDSLILLVKTLQAERDAWMKNAVDWEKARITCEQEMEKLNDEFEEYKKNWPMDGLA